MVNTATSNEQHHEEQHQHEHLHHPEPLNDPSGILSNSPNFAAVNGIQIFEPIYQPNIAEKHLKVASVTLPNGHKRDFHIHKNSKGNVLFDLAAESETLLEKDYFGLRYEDELGEMTWLYPDKRIQKQLKHKPWNFVFQIKFYPPEPSALADDLTRYLLYLQIRKEIYDGKLPASYAKQILLAAMVMQAEIGDFEAIKQSPHDYEKFLREQHLIPQIDEEVLTKVREAHKEQKGLTPNEAHQKYLDTAKDLAKYGFTFYNAKDTKNGPVILGIYAHGICVYKDQLQIHRFLWQGVNKIQFRGSKFSVVLKPGELDPKKEVTVNYRLVDYATAKKLYRTAVEHHTFFRLIKPEDKPKGTFLRRWGSDRFRYQGRTYFQAKMASQMFDHPSQVVTIQRTPSGRQVSRSVDDLAQPRSFPTSPMHYVDETTQQLTTPEKSKSYSLSTSKADKAKKKAEELSPLSVVVHDLQQQHRQQQGFKRDSMSTSGSSSPCSVSMASPNSGEYYVKSSYVPQEKSTVSPYEEVIFPLASISKEERQQQYQTPIQRSSTNRNSRVRFSSDTKPITPDDGSAVAMAPAIRPGKRKAKRRLFGPINDDHTAFSPVDDLYKAAEIPSVPLDSRVTLYDKGWYTTPSTNRALSPTGIFVGCCKPPRRTLVSERLLRNRQSGFPTSSEYSIVKRAEIEPHPIRYFVEVYHSGRPQIETRRKRRFLPRKDVDFVNPNELNKDYYNFPKEVCYDWERTECSRDPEGLPLKQFSTIYWFGGNSKQGNAKPVGIKGQNVIVSSDIQKQHLQKESEGERERHMIITDTSMSQKANNEEEVVEIVEEKPVITVRQEEGKTITTIETTTVITTSEHFEGDYSEGVKEEEDISSIQTSTPLPSKIESLLQVVEQQPIAEPVTVIETFSKTGELETVPIKKYSNVYHFGTSLKSLSPVEWVKKKKGILFIRKSSSRSQNTSTLEEPQPSTSKETTAENVGEKGLLGKRKKSSEAEPIVAKIAHEVSERARTFSMSKHYPEISRPFEGQLKEIHRNPEAQSANLFDCISFADENAIEEPRFKKAKHGRAARLCLACVGGNNRRRNEIERKSSKEFEEGHVQAEPHRAIEEARVEKVYAYEPTNVNEVLETAETATKSKKYNKIPEVIVTHDLSLIPATSEEDLQEASTIQTEVQQSDLPQQVETIHAGKSTEIAEEEETTTVTSVTVLPTPTPSEATFVEEYIQENVITESPPPKTSEISGGYPILSAPYIGDINILDKNHEAPHAEFLIENTAIPTQEVHDEDQQILNVSREERTFMKEEASVSKSAQVPKTATEIIDTDIIVRKPAVSQRTKMLAEKKHYPLIGTSYEGEYSELQRKNDFRESNLFDTISFESDSDDSGLGADSGSKRKSGLLCIPKSKKAKTSERIEKLNYTEVQANRNKKVKRARLFSFSKDYPEIGAEIFEGELSKMAPIPDAQFSNLFDEINFAPEFEKVESKQTSITKEKSKSTGLWCVPTGKQKQKRTTSIESVKSIKSEESIKKIIEKAETYSMSKYYPETGGEIYEGEMAEIEPVKNVEFINIFDAINFAPPKEEAVFEIKERPAKEKSKSSGIWCVPTSKKQKRTTSITTVKSEESIKKGTLNALQNARNKTVEKARTFSMSKDYPEIGGEIFEGESSEMAPVQQAHFTNLFDEIDFERDSEIVKVKTVEHQKLKDKKDKSSNLLCMKKSKRKTSETSSASSLSLQDHKNLNAMQIARNKLVRRARYFSTSKHYPEVGTVHEDELAEIKPVRQASFTNLFDEISFASDTEKEIKVKSDKEVIKTKKSKKSANLLCATKSKRKPSEVSQSSSGTSVSSVSLKDHKNLNAMQIARNKLVRRARYFSTSKHYPEIGGEVDEGELIEMAPSKQATFTKLFDEVSFASSSENVEDIEMTKIPREVTKMNKGLPNCFACASFKSKPKEITEEADEFAYEKVTVPQDVVLEDRFIVTHQEPLIEYVEEPTIEIIQESFVKDVQDEYMDKVVEETNVKKELTHKIHEEIYNEESVEIGLPIHNIKESREFVETILNVPSENAICETTFDEPMSNVVILSEPSTTTSSFEIEKEKISHNLSEGYPTLSEPFVGEISQLNYQQQVSETLYTQEDQTNSSFESTNPNLLVIHHERPQPSSELIQQEEEWLIGYPKSVEQQFVQPEEEELIHSEMAFKSQTYPSTSAKNDDNTNTLKTTKSLSLPWSKKKKLTGYPLYTEAFDKDVVELKRALEAPEKNLFDTISFESDSDDSGLGADSGSKRKSGLLCIPKSKKTKTSERIEKLNYTEVQANRNKKVKRARLFSFSKDYPEIGAEIFEGELSKMAPIPEAQFSNLFDEINFAPEFEKVESKQTSITKEKSKSTGLWCVPTGKQKRTTSIGSVKSIKSEESVKKITEKAETYSMSKYYPEIGGEIYEGEMAQIEPVKNVEFINIFDAINFAPPKDDENNISVAEIKQHPLIAKENSKRKSKFWCVHGGSKRKTSSVSSKSEESIQKGTLNALQVARNRLVQRARTFSVSQNYPEIGASSHEDEFYPLSPVCQASSANLFDYVSFDDEPSVLESRAALNKEQLPREQQNHLLACLTCGTTKFESSEYPAITEAYGGDITEPKTEVQKSQISETVSVSIEEAERPVTIEKSEIEQQSANTGYPIVTEAFTCPLNTIYPQRDADLTNLSEYVTFENGSDQLNDKLVSVKTIVTEKTDKWLIQENDHVKSEDKIVPQEQLIDENVQLPSISETQVYSQPPEVIITEVSDLTPQNEIPKYEITEHISFSETGEGSHRRVSQVIAAQKHIIISDEAPEMISAITNMDEPIIIECHDLTRAEEMPSKNLFDTISFESDSDDSGLGADSGSKRKSGLLCIPKSKKTKTSERIEKVNYTEVQANRNKKVKRARLFSFSKDYPEIGAEIFEGELSKMTPIPEAQFSNLFDEINFAPEFEKVESKQTSITKEKSKSTGLWCVPTGKQKQKRTTSIESVKSIKSEESIKKIIEKAETYSMSKYYPETGGEIYEGEMAEIEPVKNVEFINIFDAINFAPPKEEAVFEIKERQAKEKSKSSGIWCVPTSKKQKRTTSITSVKSEESIKKGTLNALQNARNKTVEKARTFSMSKDYPEIGGEIFEGELSEMAPIPEAHFTNLFDEIDFERDSEIVKVKTVEHQKLKDKKDKSSNLLCMKKSKRKTSETSSASSLSLQDHKNLNAMQIARNKLVRRARYFSTSKHYPEVGGEGHEGELAEIKPVQQVSFTNLFDEIDFERDSEDINVLYKKEQQTKPSKLRGSGINFLWCAPKQYDYSSYPTDNKPYTGELKELKIVEEAPSANLFDCVSFASADDINQNLFLNGHVVSQPTLFEHQQPIIIEQESVAVPYGYPIPTEIYEGEMNDLQPQKDYDHVNIYERIEQVPKGISYVPPARKPSFLDKIRRASFRESNEMVSFERETIKEEIQHVQKSVQRTEPLEIPTIIEPEQKSVEIVLEKIENTEVVELPITEEIDIVEESEVSKPHETVEVFHEQTMEMDIDLIKSGDISYHNEVTIIPDVFVTESIESETIPTTLQELKHYPIISEPFTGEISALNKEDEAPSSHLFDEINFLIIDKNVQEPPAQKITKTSKTNRFLWCGGQKQQRRETPEPITHSRSESIRSRIRTFSMSKHYPEIGGEIYEGELNKLTPSVEAPSQNLFDEISFASAGPETTSNVQTSKSKGAKKSFWCVPTGKQKRTTSIESVKSLKSEESIKKITEKAETYSMSKYYPEIGGEIYEGEMAQIKPVKNVEFINIFDAINFVPPKEEAVFEVKERPAKEKSKSSGIWCVPTSKKQKRTTSITTVKSEESIKKGTLNALQNARNKTVEKARTFSMSKDYPEIGGEIFEGELSEMEPVQQAHFTNLFDEIDFERDSEIVKVKTVEHQKLKDKKDKSTNLLCMKKSKRKTSETSSVSSLSLQDHKNLNSMQIARNKLVRRARYFSTSKHYPEVGGEGHEGELAEIKPVRQASFTNLFDEISFASDTEKEIKFDKEVIKTKKSKKSANLLCATKSKRKPSEVSQSSSGTSVSSVSLKDHKNLNAMQIARNKLVRRARYFSTSKHYPEIGGEVDEGELSEMAPSKQATFTKLFDEISFASSSENVEDIKMTKTKQPSKSFAACFSCTDRRMPKPIEEEPYEIESIGSPKSMDVPISSEIENSSTLVVIEKDLAIQTFDASSDVDQEYPLITEPYTDEISTLNLIPEIEYSTLQKNERMEEKLMAEEPFTKEYSDEFQTSENIFSEESQWISGMPEVIPTESHHEIITTQRVTSETTTFVEPTEVQEEPTKTFTNFEQVLSDYPQLTAAYETEINTLTKVSEVSPSEFKKYEESSVEPAVIIESPVVTLEEQAVDKREYETPIIFTEQQPIIVSTKYKKEDKMVPKPAVSQRTKMLAEKKHYPLIGKSYEGEYSELQRQNDFRESNLFDTISFESDSDDSGLGADSGSKRKSGLLCIPKSKKTKTSERIEKVNYTEIQANRNKKVKRARLFSFSKDYPEIGAEIFEGELSKMAPIPDAQFSNLFDEINFAPEFEKVESKQTSITKEKSKSAGLWCVPTGKQKRTTSIESVKSIKSEESIKKIIEKAETYSMSKNYPEIGGETYEGEMAQIKPVKNVEFINIFDAINFAPPKEEAVFEIKERPAKEKSKSSGIWCVPTSKKQKRTTSIESVKSEESIKKGTLNALQNARNKTVEKARTFSFSKDYPEIGGEIFEGELSEMAPVQQAHFTNLFDEIDFERDSEIINVKTVEHQKLKDKKDKSTNLLCMKKSKRKTSETSSASSLSLQDHKNLNAMQIARNKLVRRARYFSTSKHYPEVGTVHEGELAEMAPVQQAHFTNLFDEVSFASDTEENVIGKATQVKKPVSSRGNNKIILCAPFRTSSKHYPAFEEPYAGFIYDTKLKPEAPEEDLFKCVNFASSSEQEKEEDDKVTRMQSEERQPQQPRKQMATLYFRRNTKQLEGYPIISEAYIGEISQLLRHPDVETINLFDCVSFASESDDEIPISQSSNARDSSKKGSPDKPKKKQLRLFGKTRRSTSEKELDLTSYPKNEAYSGPLEEFTKVEEFNDENLRKIVTIYHSGYSQPLFRHRFVREKHEGIEEIGEAPADYEILHFTSEETTPMARMPELETLPLRSYAKYPIISFTESPKDMKRKFSKSKIIPESSSESSSQSESEVDIVPSLKPSKKKESEGFLSFFKNRLSSKQHQPRKRTGYEGLVEAFAGSYITTPKSCEIPDQPILEHVLVYHNGNSTQQPIDSGFEDGANASESERAGTFKRTGKLFFDKFKLSRDSGDKTTTEEIDKSESLEPRKVITGYESLNTKPFLGLHSSTLYSAEVEQHPLSSTIDSLPAVYYYEGDATLTPFPTETTEIKISTLERIMKTKKSRKDSNFAYEYLSIEGPIIDTNKKDEMIDLPIGEHVTVYHCGRSDVPTAEVPPEVYVYEKEEPISESLQSLTTETVEPQIEQMEIEQKTTTKHESLQSSYPEYFMYEGPIESLERLPETENQHLNEYVNIYHSGLSTDNAAAKKIVISDIEGKAKQYSFDTTPFEGEIEETLAQKELEHLPLHEHAFTYHPGKSEVEMLEDLEEREIQTRELSLIQRLMAMFKKRELQGYPSISEEYTGPIEEINRSEDIKKSELKNITNVYHSGYSYDPKTSKLTLRRFAPRRRLRINTNDYPKNIAPMDAVIYDLHTTEDIPKTPSPVTLPPESLIFQPSKQQQQQQRQPSKWYRFWFLRRRGQSSQGLEPSMPIIVESMSHRITDTSASLIMATTDRSLFLKGHWPVTDIDVDVMLKTVTKCQCECEALIIEKSFETGIAGSIQLQQHLPKQTTLNDTSFRMDNNCIMQTSNGTWLAKVTKKISTQMEQINKKTDNIIAVAEKKAELFIEKSEPKNDDEVPPPPPSPLPPPSLVVEEKAVENKDDKKEEEEEEEDEIEVPRNYSNSSEFSKWDIEPPYLWSSEVYENLEELIDNDEIISKESGDLPLTHEKKELKFNLSSVRNRDSEMFASIRRRLSEKLAKKEKKKDEKRLKKEEKERKKHASKSGAVTAGHVGASSGGYASESSSSSASVSDAEIEERHVVINKAIEGPVQILNRGQELGDLDNIEESLQSTVDKCIRDTERMPRVQMVEANVLVKECEPLPHGISEGSAPHTTLHSWHETEDGPETITTEVDEHGNKITRTIKTQTTKHTIQKQTYQTYAVEDADKPDQTIVQTKESTIPLGNQSVTRSPVVHTKTRTVAYEKGSVPHENIDPIGELVSTKTITTGNRTVEILTYKTEKDGVIETRVEHRVTIHSGDNIDHDAELAKALLEATEMSPDLIINRVEVEKQTQR